MIDDIHFENDDDHYSRLYIDGVLYQEAAAPTRRKGFTFVRATNNKIELRMTLNEFIAAWTDGRVRDPEDTAKFCSKVERALQR